MRRNMLKSFRNCGEPWSRRKDSAIREAISFDCRDAADIVWPGMNSRTRVKPGDVLEHARPDAGGRRRFCVEHLVGSVDRKELGGLTWYAHHVLVAIGFDEIVLVGETPRELRDSRLLALP